MLKPKTDKESFEFNHYMITKTESSFNAFKIMIESNGSEISKKMSECITDEQIATLIKKIYDNTDFKKYDEYKYWFKHYFLAMYLNKLRDEIIEENIQPSQYYAEYIKNYKKTCWFDKCKLMLTSDIFFDYLKDRYYYLKSDKVIAREYYKDRLKFYKFVEKILFFNKYHAFNAMQDFYYNAKRTAKYHFKMNDRINFKKNNTPIVIKLILVHLLAAIFARFFVDLYVG